MADGQRGRGRPSKMDYIPLREAGDLFREAGLPCSIRSLERMMDAGMLPFRRTPGGQRKLYRSGVENYLRSTVDSRSTGA